MKKFVVLAIVALMAAGSVSASDLVINGIIPAKLSVAITNSPITITLDGEGGGASGDRTATLTAKSNQKNWTISFDSSSNGYLLSSTVSGVQIPYLLQASFVEPAPTWVRTSLVNSLGTAAVNPEGQTIVVTGGKTPKNGVDFTLTASIVAQNGADVLFEAANDYTDTITISIASP